jgi:glycerophosphoryl diester phosphodiesterase
MEDQLGGTSNVRAVTHAIGPKAYAEFFGLEADSSISEPSAAANTGKTMYRKQSQLIK